MFKMSEAAAGLCVLAAGILVCAPAVGADQSCTLVTLEPGSKAEDVKAKLKLTDRSTFAVECGDAACGPGSDRAVGRPAAGIQ